MITTPRTPAPSPIEMSSGGRVVHRLSRRGNRQLNHAIHIAAITQIRFAHSPGRAFFDRKVAEGKTKTEAVRALKRRISDAIYRQLLHDAANMGPGGQTGTALESSVTGLEPQQPALRKNHSRTRPNARTRRPAAPTTRRSPSLDEHEHEVLTTKRKSIGSGPGFGRGLVARVATVWSDRSG